MAGKFTDPRFDLVELKYRDEGESLVSVSRSNPLPVEQIGYVRLQPYRYTNITAAAPTTTIIKKGRGTLGKIIVNKAAATGVITVYDNVVGATTLIATITMPATLLANHFVFQYDIEFANGLTIVTATAAQDITVTWC